MRWFLRAFVAAALLVALWGWMSDAYTPVYGLAPLLGLLIFRIGLGSLMSFRQGAAHIPSGDDPIPVDTTRERVVFVCDGCGCEVLLLVQGTPMAPRHCGERMNERREVPHDLSR